MTKRRQRFASELSHVKTTFIVLRIEDEKKSYNFEVFFFTNLEKIVFEIAAQTIKDKTKQSKVLLIKNITDTFHKIKKMIFASSYTSYTKILIALESVKP